jgi:hypothetical protein
MLSHRITGFSTLNRILTSLVAVFFSCTALAATGVSDQVGMTARYQDMLHCMDQAMGKGWQSRYDIDIVTNRWGAAETSAHDIGEAPQAIRLNDLRCRRELSLDGQPRPD